MVRRKPSPNSNYVNTNLKIIIWLFSCMHSLEKKPILLRRDYLLAIFAIFAITPSLLMPTNSHGNEVIRNASETNSNSLSLKVRHSLTARSTARTTGNTRVYAESNIFLDDGSSVSTVIGGDTGLATIEFDTAANTGQMSASGFNSDSLYVLKDPTSFTSELSKIDASAPGNTFGDASSSLIQETTLGVTFQDRESISTFQQSF